MGAHGIDKQTICPICQRRFDRALDCKQHMKRKRHTTHAHVPEPWAKYAPEMIA